MEKMLKLEMQIAEGARKYQPEALTNLQEFIDKPLLQESFDTLNKKGTSAWMHPERVKKRYQDIWKTGILAVLLSVLKE